MATKSTTHDSPPAVKSSKESGHISLGTLRRWNDWIESLAGFEARGMVRVLGSERHAPSAMAMFLLWFSANLTINNPAVGLTGPLVFQLGFRDSAMCAVVGIFLGAMSTAYMSTWGAATGNRTMACDRVQASAVWVIVLCAIQLVCGVAERHQLFIIFTSFRFDGGPSHQTFTDSPTHRFRGYWVTPMIYVVIKEHLLFRRGVEPDWTAWDDKSWMPIGIADLIVFWLGWMGAILGMYGVWYVGPLANALGGADVGTWFGCLFG
ncbi:Vitamin B6 transporter [Elasticomyces elasticus]|nr:Vitamin B6 transporter [Elasticomyces elasticus]